MKHLIVVAHPVKDSFTMALTHAYAVELEKLRHSQQTYDLYRMGFNPILPAHELAPTTVDNPISTDIAQAQGDIRAADILTVIYPLWWLSMPAMMKGYIDRVFARGFAIIAQRCRAWPSGRQKICPDYGLGGTSAAADRERQMECGGSSAGHAYLPVGWVRIA